MTHGEEINLSHMVDPMIEPAALVTPEQYLTDRESSTSRRSLKKALARCAVVACVTVVGGYAFANGILEQNYDVGSGVPDTLPAAVAAEVSSAVQVEVSLPSSTERTADNKGYAHMKSFLLSGVTFPTGDVLTAGHSLLNEQGRPLAAVNCGEIFVRGRDASGRPYTIVPNKSAAMLTNNHSDDAAVLITTRREWSVHGPHTSGATPLDRAATPPHKKETVFFINWELDKYGRSRNPLITESDSYLKKPAVFAGEVQHIDGTVARVVTGLRSYDPDTGKLNRAVPDEASSPAQSGGMVVHADGTFMGLSNMSGTSGIPIVYSFFTHKIGRFGLPNNAVSADVTLVPDSEIYNLTQQAEAAQPFEACK